MRPLLALSLPLAALLGCAGWENPDSPAPARPTQTRTATPPACGDQACNGDETCTSCPGDCGQCPVAGPSCGDGKCNGVEKCDSCPADCGGCDGGVALCGNGKCDPSESCSSCVGDCGACPVVPACGDTVCSGTESCSTCAGDCGACPPPCPATGTFSIEDMAIRDNASGQYIIGVKGDSPVGPVTVSGVRLINGTFVNNHLVVQNANGGFEAFVFLPGRPDCTAVTPTQNANCTCNFAVTVSAGANKCMRAAIPNCMICGASSPMDHQGDVGCTRPFTDAGM